MPVHGTMSQDYSMQISNEEKISTEKTQQQHNHLVNVTMTTTSNMGNVAIGFVIYITKIISWSKKSNGNKKCFCEKRFPEWNNLSVDSSELRLTEDLTVNTNLF